MRIGLISDTHLHHERLPQAVVSAFQDLDLILHAGDLVSLRTLHCLEEIAPVVAVQGNMDGVSLRTSLPRKIRIEAEGHSIGLVHGHYVPHPHHVLSGTVDFQTMHEYLIHEFEDDPVDCIVYGHTHHPLVEKMDNICIVNPGSATRSRNGPCTVGILTAVHGGLNAQIIELV